MSLPDYLLDPPDDSVCEECGDEPICRHSRHLCSGCFADLYDVWADAAYEDLVSQKGNYHDD